MVGGSIGFRPCAPTPLWFFAAGNLLGRVLFFVTGTSAAHRLGDEFSFFALSWPPLALHKMKPCDYGVLQLWQIIQSILFYSNTLARPTWTHAPHAVIEDVLDFRYEFGILWLEVLCLLMVAWAVCVLTAMHSFSSLDSKLERGNMELYLEPVDMVLLAKRVLTSFSGDAILKVRHGRCHPSCLSHPSYLRLSLSCPPYTGRDPGFD